MYRSTLLDLAALLADHALIERLAAGLPPLDDDPLTFALAAWRDEIRKR